MRNALHLGATLCEQERSAAIKGIVTRSVIEQAFLGWWCGAVGEGKLADVDQRARENLMRAHGVQGFATSATTDCQGVEGKVAQHAADLAEHDGVG